MLLLLVFISIGWGLSIWLNWTVFIWLRRLIQQVGNTSFEPEVADCSKKEKGMSSGSQREMLKKPKAESEETKQLKSRLIALSAVTMAVNQTTDVDQILNDVLGIILEATAYDGGVIFLQEEETNRHLSLRASKGSLLESICNLDRVETDKDHPLFPAVEDLFREAQKRKQIILIFNRHEIKLASELSDLGIQQINEWGSKGIGMLAFIPLMAKGKTLGLMVLTRSIPRQPSLEENDFLEAIGQQVGMTLENINLLSEWTKKAHDLSMLNETLSTFSTSLKLDQISYVLTQQVMKSLSADSGWVALLDQKKESLIWKTSIFNAGESLSIEERVNPKTQYDPGDQNPSTLKKIEAGKIIPLRELPLHQQAIQTGKLVRINQANQVESAEQRLIPLRKKGEAILIPFAIGNRTLGVVGVGMRSVGKLENENLNLCRSIASQAAFAIENSLLYEDVKQKAEEVLSLYQVGQRLSSILDLDQLLEQTLKAVVESFGYLNCAILLVDKNSHELFIKAAHGFSGDHIRKLRIKIGQEGITGWVAKTGEPSVVGDVSREPRYVMGKEGCRSEIAVPLKLKGEIIGVLDAESEKLFAFGDKDIRILTQLASQIAVVLENSRLFTEERKSNLKLSLINDVGRKVVSTLNLDKLLDSTIEVIHLSLKYDNISLFLEDGSGGDLILKSYCGKSTNLVQPGYRHKRGMGMVGMAAERGKTILCNDVTEEPSYIPAIADTLSELCVPIKSGGTVVGILDVECFSKNQFNQQDVAVLETIADLLASAINNTQLYNDTRRKAWRLELVDQINRAISSTLDLNGVFHIVSRELNKIVNYDRISLCFWHPARRLFKLEMSFCPNENLTPWETKCMPADETNMYQVIDGRKPYHQEKLVLNPESKPADRLLYSEGIRSYVLIPVRDNENVTAVLSLESIRERGFGDDQIQLLNSIADHLSVALQNAKLFSDLEEAYRNLKNTQSHMIQIERFRALGEMAGGVVHDFNNILASILGRVQLLLLKLKKGEQSISPDIETSLQVIERSVTDGAKILSRLREFVKENSDQTFSRVNLNALIEDSLEMTGAYWKDEASLSGTQIEIKKELNATGMVRGDATELREVLTNLLLNAGDAMSRGGTLTLITWEDPEFIYISVKDTGVGMTEEVRGKIFVPFFTTKGEKGTGLGLSLTYGIITKHQGEISVESRSGQGSTFTIKLPRCCDRMENKGSNLIPRRGEGHILVIEDEKNIREVLEEILSSAGYTVTQAENGEEGVLFFKSHKIDLVITDLGMPGMSGWEVADRIKELNPHTPVILSTGWGVKIDQAGQKRKNVDLAINKPFNMQQILSNIEELLIQRGVLSEEPAGAMYSTGT